MEWKKASPILGILLESALQPFPCQKKTMFGSPVYTVNGHMFAGVHADSIFLRLAGPDRDELVTKHPGAAPFEPMPAHVMQEYVTVPVALFQDSKVLQQWLARAHGYALSLPPKQPKRRTAKKRAG